MHRASHVDSGSHRPAALSAGGRSPWLVGPRVEPPRRVWIAGAFAVAGGLLGLALAEPTLAALAWPSAALVAAALSWTRRVVAAFAGAALVQFIAFFIALDWVMGMNAMTFDFTLAENVGFMLAQAGAWALPFASAVTLGYVIFRRRLWVVWWLPVAWVVGETLRFEVMVVALGDWMASQWQFTPALRAVGHLGWWGANALCLAAAFSVGCAAAARRPRFAAPALLATLTLALLPALPTAGVERLEGVVAVHTRSTVELPHGPPPIDGPDDATELVIWPESAFELRPRLPEGVVDGARIRPLLFGSDAAHLVGLITSWPRRLPQNQAVAISPDGAVHTRAKRRLMPVAEGTALRVFGDDIFERGQAAPLLRVAGRAIIPLICGEFMSRALVAEGRAAGGEVLAVLARDQMMHSARARRQLLAIQVLRSVEYGLPSVRASYGGEANFVAPDGRVLAAAGPGTNGLLRWDPARGARDHDYFGRAIEPGVAAPTPPAPDIAVLYDDETPRFRTRCPAGRCRYHPLGDDDDVCVGESASTVIVAGHGDGRRWASQSAEALAARIRCFEPALVVIDTCLGAAAPLMAALADLDAVVVAASTMISLDGLEYRRAFFEPGDPLERAHAVVDPVGTRLLRWRADRAEIDAAVAQADALSGAELRRRLASRQPPRVRVALGAAGEVLVPFEWHRAKSAPPVHRRSARASRVARKKQSPVPEEN